MPTAKQRAYSKALNDIVKRYNNLDHETIKRMVALLQDLRKNIAAELLNAGGFDAFRLTQLQQGVGSLIDDFNFQLTQNINQSFEQVIQLGAASVVEPLKAGGINGLYYAPTTAQINIALDFSAELIQNITEPMRALINTQLRLATLRGDSPFNVMKELTNILGVKARDGIWGVRNRPEVVKGVAARAEAIVRTESTRMLNMATHSQQLAIAQQIPEIKKEWMATGAPNTRATHLNAHGQQQPIDQPFQVGLDQLMYPGDPAGSPEETVNCRCGQRTIHPDIGELPPNPLDEQIQAEKERRNG